MMINARLPWVRRCCRRLCCCWLLSGIGLGGSCQLRADETLQQKLQPLLQSHQGDVAVGVHHLESGATVWHRADDLFPTASLIKFPVLVDVYRQVDRKQLQLGRRLELRDEDKVPGSGILTEHFSSGLQLSLRDALRLMIVYSDNTATNLVLDQVGLESLAKCMDELECPNTRLHAKVYRQDSSIDPDKSKQFGLGRTTAREIIRLFSLLQDGKLVSPASTQAMMDDLFACDDRQKLARNLPDDVRFAHKTGSVSASRCDAGILTTGTGPVAICVLTANNQDRSRNAENQAEQLCGSIGRVVYDHFTPKATPSNEPRQLTEGAHGALVEAVQRTLNARLDPSPALSVDGDFGPMTRQAVERFQAGNGMPVNGIVETTTWSALGPLLEKEPAVPEPDAVNGEELPLLDADPLEGQPFVSCRAWAIADASSGELLWQSNALSSRSCASITKLMTLYLVVREARQDPRLWDQEVVFSRRADTTPGSTAGIRAGEKLPLRELLYGLMLPSGNDASVALAEHLGTRWLPDSEDEHDVAGSAYDAFVSRMNQAAQELGMAKTTFKNPHGLTVTGHVTTASDLIKLAHAAYQWPEVRSYVGTRQRGCRLTSVSGYTRDVVWKNTNKLLGQAGYTGIKTGTTSSAGACLLSCGERSDRRLFVVVLGASGSAARYSDARNLYRWAWQQLAAEDDATER